MDRTFTFVFGLLQNAFFAAFLCIGFLAFVWVTLHRSWNCVNRGLVLWIMLLGYSYAVMCLIYTGLFQYNLINCNSTKLSTVLNVITFVLALALIDRMTVMLLGQTHGMHHRLKESPVRMIMSGLGISLFILLSFLEHHLGSHDTVYQGSFFIIFCSENWAFSACRHMVEYTLVYCPLMETFLQCAQQRFRRKPYQLTWNSQCLRPGIKLHGCKVKGPCLCGQLQKPFTLLYMVTCSIIFLVRPLVILVCLLSGIAYRDVLLGMSLCSVEAYLSFELVQFAVFWKKPEEPLEAKGDELKSDLCLVDGMAESKQPFQSVDCL